MTYSIIDTQLDVQIVTDNRGRLIGYCWPEPNGEGGEYWVAQALAGNCSRWDKAWQEQPFATPDEAGAWIADRSPWLAAKGAA